MQISCLIQDIKKAIRLQALEELGQQQSRGTAGMSAHSSEAKLSAKSRDQEMHDGSRRSHSQPEHAVEASHRDIAGVNATAVQGLFGAGKNKSAREKDADLHAGVMDVDAGAGNFDDDGKGSEAEKASACGRAPPGEAMQERGVAEDKASVMSDRHSERGVAEDKASVMSDRHSEFCVGSESQAMKERNEALKAWIASKFGDKSTDEQDGSKGGADMQGSGWREQKVRTMFLKSMCVHVLVHVQVHAHA
jgi:hypothetical protein